MFDDFTLWIGILALKINDCFWFEIAGELFQKKKREERERERERERIDSDPYVSKNW